MIIIRQTILSGRARAANGEHTLRDKTCKTGHES